MELTAAQIDAFFTQLNQIVSAVQTTAIGKRTYTPYYYSITGPATGTIPAGVKSYHIINLGLNANGKTFDNLGVTGITGTTSISKLIPIIGYKVENDQNLLANDIVITPAADHVVVLQYLK